MASSTLASPKRLLIVTDGDRWFIRRVVLVVQDDINDEKVYRCDRALGRNYPSLASAARAATAALSNPIASFWRRRGKR